MKIKSFKHGRLIACLQLYGYQQIEPKIYLKPYSEALN